MIGGVHKILSHEPLNSYSSVVQWDTGRLMLILKCILIFQRKIIDFVNAFAQADIPSGKPVFIELPRYFTSDGGQCDVVLRLNKILYGQSEEARP